MAARKLLRFAGAYLQNNLAAALEYRASLVSQVMGMFMNDLLWVFFWGLYFTKFPIVKGWTLEDILVLWAVVTASFGLATGLFSNCMRIPQLIVEGQLDYYLSLPQNVLVHLLVSRISLLNLGDALFGPVLLFVMVKLTWVKVLVYLATTLLSAILLTGFFVLGGSLVFFLGNADALSAQLNNALIHFATYPTGIFGRGVRVVLFTVIPAGFISTLPVELVREFDLGRFLLLAGGAALFFSLAVLVFNLGLRRYESGNLMGMRS